MMKKIILFAGMSMIAATVYGASTTISYTGLVGPWEGNVIAPYASGDRYLFQSGCNVSISTQLAYDAWITVGSTSNGGILSIESTGGFISAAASNMSFGLGTGGIGVLNLSGSFRTTGAMYFGYNGGMGTASITGGTLSTSNAIWVGRSQGTSVSSGYISMTSGTLVAGTALNIAGYTNAAVTSNTEMNGYVDLQGGSMRVASLVMGNSTAKVSNANLTISSAMSQATVTGAFTMNSTASLTLDAAANTDWTTKGAILAVGGTFSVSSTAVITLDLTDFNGWTGMSAGDTITLTLISYGSLTAPGGANISAVGLSNEYTLGSFNVDATSATVDITYTPVPEPALAAGLLGTCALALAVRRRRKR